MLKFLNNREIAELSYFWAGVLMLIVTVVAHLYAIAQVIEAKNTSKIAARKGTENLILNLLEQWDSPKMWKARKIFGEFKAATQNIINS